MSGLFSQIFNCLVPFIVFAVDVCIAKCAREMCRCMGTWEGGRSGKWRVREGMGKMLGWLIQKHSCMLIFIIK